MTAPTPEWMRIRFPTRLMEQEFQTHYLRGYEAGRTAALEQAAQECDALASIEGIAQRCAAAIRAMKGGKP